MLIKCLNTVLYRVFQGWLNKDNPLEMGPFAKLLLTIAKIQVKFPTDKSPIRTALVTARSAPTHERVIKTFNVWGVRVDEAFFLGGTDKYEILEAFGADIFLTFSNRHPILGLIK